MDEDIKELSTWEEAETLLKVKGASLRRIQNQKTLWERMNAEQSAEEVVASTSSQTSKRPLWVLLILAALIGSYFYGQSEIQNLIPWEILNGNENS